MTDATSHSGAGGRTRPPNPPSLQVMVMAHPKRRHQAERLARTIDAKVVYDPSPQGPPSALRTLYAALAQHATGRRYSHCLVVQDDAVPHPDLVTHTRAMLSRYPAYLLCLYVGHVHACRKQMLSDYRRGRRYTRLPLKHFVPTVATCWPKAAATDFVDYLDEHDVQTPQDDEAVMAWRIARFPLMVRAMGCIPSLVRHDNTPPSLLNGAHGPRDALIPWQAWDKQAGWEVGW